MDYTFHCENPRCGKIAPVEGAMVERLAKTLDQFMKSAGK